MPSLPGRRLVAVSVESPRLAAARTRQLAAPTVHPARRARLSAGLTINQAAYATGLSSSLLRAVEMNRRRLTPTVAARLAAVLRVEPSALLP